MKKKIVSIFLAIMLAISTIIFAGCEPNNPQNPENPTPPPTTPSAEYYVNFKNISVTLNKGESTTPQLTFTADGVNADISQLTFSSDNPAVATVNASGVITALSGGYCNIVASIGTGENEVRDSIYVRVNEYTVSFDSDSYSLLYAETIQVSTKAYYNGTLETGVTGTITSSNENVAKVIDGNWVKGMGEGTATLTVNYMGATDTATVTVGVPQFNIMLSSDNYIVSNQEPITINYQALAGTNIDENPILEWHIADTSIATVNANGVVTGLKNGTTTLTVNYHGITDTATIKVVETVAAEYVNAFNEDYINIYGRTYTTANRLSLEHVSTGVEVAIFGSQLSVNVLVSSSSPYNGVYVRLYIDGVEQSERVFMASSSSVTNYLLAKNLTDDYHTIRMVKTSENFVGTIHVDSFSAPAFAVAKQPTGIKIEFIGDSITAGYGAISTGSWSDVGSDGTASYSYQTAQRLNATYSIVARQGICVKRLKWTNYNMYDNLYPYVSKNNQTPYAFNFNPDVVVLALGTNDASYVTGGSTQSKDPANAGDYTKAMFTTDYKNMLTYVRQKNPNAYIVCIYGMMGKKAVIDDGITDAVASFNDSKVSYINDWVADSAGQNGHPAKSAHTNYSIKLATYIENLLN